MPRARKSPPDGRADNGGSRQGTPGVAYENRSDLQTQKPTAAPNQEYGKAGAQLAAQRAVPIAAAAPPGAAPGQTFGGDMAHIPIPPGYVAPGEVTPLHAPTERPDEPLTHGLPVGPGGGPEALGSMAPTNNLGALLSQAAATLGASPDVKALAQFMAQAPR